MIHINTDIITYKKVDYAALRAKMHSPLSEIMKSNCAAFPLNDVNMNPVNYDYYTKNSEKTDIIKTSPANPSVSTEKIFSPRTNKLNYIRIEHETTLLDFAQQNLGLYEITKEEFELMTEDERLKTQHRVIGTNGSIKDQWCAHAVSYLSLNSGMRIGKHKKRVDDFIAWAGKDYKQIPMTEMTKNNYIEERKNRAARITEQLKYMHEGDYIIWKTTPANKGKFIVKLEDNSLQQCNRSHIGIIEHIDLNRNIVTVIEGNANEPEKKGNCDRVMVRTSNDGFNGNQEIGEHKEINRRDGLIRKQYTVEELAAFGYTGYIDNSARVIKK